MTNKIFRTAGLAAIAVVMVAAMFAALTPAPVVDAAVAWALTRTGSTVGIASDGQINITPKSGKTTVVTRALAANGGISIGSGGATATKILTGTASVDFTALAAGTCENFTITVTGAANGDPVFVGIPAAAWATTEYATIQAFVSGTDTVTVKRCNLTNATTALSNPAPVTIRATVVQF
jgi:hypothetical protein